MSVLSQRRGEFAISGGQMHLVVLHGYLLSGSGSNIYTVNVAKTWRQLGHAVTVVCQDRKAATLDFVDECFVGTANVPSVAPTPGTVRVVVPDIDGLLLVYVYNRYDGFRVKAMGNPDCTEAEIENYIATTAAGLRKVLAQGVDRVLANHVLLSPAVAKRACEGSRVPFDIKVHGSSLTFSLTQRPELMKYAVEGLRACEKIVAGTKYIVEQLEKRFEHVSDEIGLHKKLVVIPPGMDPNVFRPLESVATNQQCFLDKVAEFMASKPGGRPAGSAIALPDISSQQDNLHEALVSLAGSYNQWAVDCDLLDRWPEVLEDEPIVCYFGAFLHTKGVGELLASFPTVLAQVPKARLLLIGYGGYREHMEGMLHALESGDVDAFVAFAQAGNFLDASSEQLRRLFRPLSHEERQRITITGILGHEQLREVLPMASIVVVASKAAEAFGMVTVEAMASGVLPLSHCHSGIKDILDVVKQVDPELGTQMHMQPVPGGTHRLADGAHLVDGLPTKIVEALAFLYPNAYGDHTWRREVGVRLRSIAMAHFSWSEIGKALLRPLTGTQTQ